MKVGELVAKLNAMPSFWTVYIENDYGVSESEDVISVEDAVLITGTDL